MIFEHFPYTNTHDLNLDWILNIVRKMSDELEAYVVNNQITFADPINWIITSSYAAHTITKDPATDTWYISRKPVPPGILISNGAYWEQLGAFPQAEQSLICNVADYGVLGVDGADYTAQLQEALDNTNYIAYYFPAGTYSFGTVYTSRPVLLFGAGETTIWKPLHRIATSNQYKTMLESTGDLEIRDIHIVGNNSVETQTGERFYQSAIIKNYNSIFKMSGCIIDQIYDTYHLSVGTLPFYERNGILLYCLNSTHVEISNNEFKRFGGEELTWFGRTPDRFNDDVTYNVHHNRFVDNDADSGSLGGSAINVNGGVALFHDNYGENYTQRGSHVNLICKNTAAYNNYYTHSDMGSFIDCCEGYYVKSDFVIIHNNYFDDIHGSTTYAIKAQARNIQITNNHLEAACPIKTYAITDVTAEEATLWRKNANIEWNDYDSCIISGNSIIITMQPANAQNAGISINQTSRDVGSRAVQKLLKIIGNSIKYKNEIETYYAPVFLYSNVLQYIFANNTIDNAGVSVPSSSRINYLTFNDAMTDDSIIYISNNIFKNRISTNAIILHGISTSINNAKIFASSNIADSISNIYIGVRAAISSRTVADYNLNFTANFV